MYTDGACIGNPGPGGYGVVLLYSQHRKELAHGFRLTTNNRMELSAVIVGLQQLKEPCQMRVFSDSRYVVDGIEKGWAKRWQTQGWKNKSKPVPNADLWRELLALCQQHTVLFTWVRGHAGNSENERCDVLSNVAARGKNLDIDTGYEKSCKR
jgi:ribonuclease HI